MAQEIKTVVAQLIDEASPAAAKMQAAFESSMDKITGSVDSVSESFKSLDFNTAGIDTAVSSLQNLAGSVFNVGDSFAVLESVSVLQDIIDGGVEAGNVLTLLSGIAADTGSSYMEMGLRTVESLTEIMGNSEEILGSIGDYFGQFKEDALSGAVGFASAVSDIGAKLTAQAKSQVEAQRKADIEKVKHSAMNEEEKAKAIAEIDKKAEAEKKKIAQAEKAMAITKAVINSGLAVVNALATPPFPVGLAMSAVAAAQGAAQVAAISSQSFAQGGIVGGTSYTGDNVAARVNSGEMVLTRGQQSQLFAMANGGGGGGNTISMGGDTIVINGNADQDAVDQIRQTKQEQMEQMKDLLKEMKYHGQLEL
ncbi:MAG: hypothetical protein LBI42_12465 [Chitinispirillales bacterium]|jgi:hypothetical protein|nr:hypothetical protein [Chitinispirillales bacterium]